MKLHDGIEQYVRCKHASGCAFNKGEILLTALSRLVGDVELKDIRTETVRAYLDRNLTSVRTWRSRYQMLNSFFDFWSSRGAMPALLMPFYKAPSEEQPFISYIFTHAELRALLDAAMQIETPRRNFDRQTMRTLILLLYGTGALLGEIIALELRDIDLSARVITIRSRLASRARRIPIGQDLKTVIAKYLAWRSRRRFQSSYVLVTKDDSPINAGTALKNFRRACEVARISRRDASASLPRLHDLKFTFAVHRITSWIRNGKDLNRMLPALAAYMGQVGLGGTERYLSMTPERFREHLNSLSSARGKTHWRSDKRLMKFLTNCETVSKTARIDDENLEIVRRMTRRFGYQNRILLGTGL
jgi:integrase